MHAVGKDMVATMLTVGGFDVKDVGADVDSEVFITAAEEFGAQIIGLLRPDGPPRCPARRKSSTSSKPRACATSIRSSWAAVP